jgi:hypothetical protein
MIHFAARHRGLNMAGMRTAFGVGVFCLTCVTCVACVVCRAVVVEAAAAAPQDKTKTCADLAALAIPQVEVTSAREVPAGPFTPPGETRPLTVSAFCRVEATAHPTSDSSIAIEVWIPPAGVWNGKLLGTGNGGFAGSIGYGAMAAALARGYAAAGTDTGHTGDQLAFGLGHPEKATRGTVCRKGQRRRRGELYLRRASRHGQRAGRRHQPPTPSIGQTNAGRFARGLDSLRNSS